MEGLSICIPVYNRDVRKLVGDLSRQAQALDCAYEIVIADDHSTLYTQENRELSTQKNVRYLEREENVGRSKIRNYLVKESRYAHLIMMDCDVEIASEQYLKKYLEVTNKDIVCGGCTYHVQKPEKKFLLRWKYGKATEERSAKERRKEPNKSFTPFNFMTQKSILEKIPFNESIKKYGHEDTLLGCDLEKAGIEINHIDNALFHLGLDDTDTFLRKTEEAIKNMQYLARESEDKELIERSFNLIRFYNQLKRWHLTKEVKALTRWTRWAALKNLHSHNPSIAVFQWYKLGYFLQIQSE